MRFRRQKSGRIYEHKVVKDNANEKIQYTSTPISKAQSKDLNNNNQMVKLEILAGLKYEVTRISINVFIFITGFNRIDKSLFGTRIIYHLQTRPM